MLPEECLLWLFYFICVYLCLLGPVVKALPQLCQVSGSLMSGTSPTERSTQSSSGSSSSTLTGAEWGVLRSLVFVIQCLKPLESLRFVSDRGWGWSDFDARMLHLRVGWLAKTNCLPAHYHHHHHHHHHHQHHHHHHHHDHDHDHHHHHHHHHHHIWISCDPHPNIKIVVFFSQARLHRVVFTFCHWNTRPWWSQRMGSTCEWLSSGCLRGLQQRNGPVRVRAIWRRGDKGCGFWGFSGWVSSIFSHGDCWDSCASFQTFKGSSSWPLSWSLPLPFIRSWLCQGGGMWIFTFNPCRSGCHAWGETAAWPSTVSHQESAEPTFCRAESLRSAPRASGGSAPKLLCQKPDPKASDRDRFIHIGHIERIGHIGRIDIDIINVPYCQLSQVSF